MKPGLLILGHGSRAVSSNAEFEAFVQAYRDTRKDYTIAHGYIELAQPAFPLALEALARQAQDIAVLPLFLFAGGHAKNDIALVLHRVRQNFPRHHFHTLRPLGVHLSLVQLAIERARAVCPPAPSKTAAIVVGRGSSDADANSDFYKAVRLFAEGSQFSWVFPCFIGITSPLFPEALTFLARARPQHLIILPYFLFLGRLLQQLHREADAFQKSHPWLDVVVAPPLGPDARLFPIMDARLREAVEGPPPLPCETCQYRLPVAQVAEKEGGLTALLWSLRHSFTHTQAMPHIHAHRPLKKHVLVCTNADCADRGSLSLFRALQRQLQAAGRGADIRLTRTSCMGRCGEGPTVAVYPDGIWYRGVRESDAAEFVETHLLGDRLLSRLVDNIMQ